MPSGVRARSQSAPPLIIAIGQCYHLLIAKDERGLWVVQDCDDKRTYESLADLISETTELAGYVVALAILAAYATADFSQQEPSFRRQTSSCCGTIRLSQLLEGSSQSWREGVRGRAKARK